MYIYLSIYLSIYQSIYIYIYMRESRESEILRDKFLRSKLRMDYEEERNAFIYGRRNCGICNFLEPGNEFKRSTTWEACKTTFHFIVTVNV